MTPTQQEILDAIQQNRIERLISIIIQLQGRYAALYILYIIKYKIWDIDQLINMVKSFSDLEEGFETKFEKHLKLKIFS